MAVVEQVASSFANHQRDTWILFVNNNPNENDTLN